MFFISFIIFKSPLLQIIILFMNQLILKNILLFEVFQFLKIFKINLVFNAS